MENLVVVDFEQDYAQHIFEIYSTALSNFEKFEVTPKFITDCAARNDFMYKIALVGGKPAGFCGALSFQAVGRAELGPIVVSESYRNMGVGSGLVNEVIKHLKKNQIRRVSVFVKARNKSALQFFQKKGFSYDAFLRSYTLDGEDVVLMSANI